jgi:hypothetical protein
MRLVEIGGFFDKALERRLRDVGSQMHHPQQLQNDKDDGNDEQDVDDIAHFRDSRTYRPTEEAEQP